MQGFKLMNNTLYPHEQIIEIFKKPNSLCKATTWLIFAFSMLIIECFITFIFSYICNVMNITDFTTLPFIFVIYGLNTCCYLTLILLIIGIIGLGQSLWRIQ
jgi:hypothetical protein